MKPLLTNRTEDLPGLVMENELLRYEVTHLRARLAAAERLALDAQQARAEATEATEAVEAAGVTEAARADGTDGTDGTTAAATRADLVWLLSRLESSPASHLLRRRPRYRQLVSRYLETEAHDG